MKKVNYLVLIAVFLLSMAALNATQVYVVGEIFTATT